MDGVICNGAGFEAGDTVRVLQPFRDLSVFWNEERVFIEPMVDWEDEPCIDLHFIRREAGISNYVSVGSVFSVTWGKYSNYYRPAIEDFLPIVRINDPGERYTRTIEWYIRWNDYPDEDFLAYYKEKGLISDSTILSEAQSANARLKFMQGKEGLLRFIEQDFPADVYSYYLNKMRRIRNKRNHEFRDKYDFTRCINSVMSLDYSSMDYFLKQQLTKDYTSVFDRNRIMDHFISKMEELLEEASST
ncbi:MAG: hypothetical protein LUE10_06350 [Alistipes sp.]|nr:hypothetical protein [Alistipes sp.]